MLGDILEGWDRGWVGGRLKKEGICIYLWLICAVEQQKPTQDCKAIIFQLKLKIKKINNFKFGLSSVQLPSHVQLFATPWTTACQASLSINSSRSPPKSMSIESVMPSNHLILCHPYLLMPSIFPSIRVFSNESAVYIRWPKFWSLSFNISPSNEHPGLSSFRMDWLDLLSQKNCTKKIFTTQIIMMLWSLT